VDGDLFLKSLFVNTLSHEIFPCINLRPLSPSFVVDNPLFYDHSLDAFIVYFNPSFNLSMPLDYDIASSPLPFMLNYDYRELNQEFENIKIEEFFHINFVMHHPV